MIARIWRGWAHRTTAQAYAQLLRNRVLPEFSRIRGYLGAYVFRRAVANAETEYTVLTLFRDIDAVRAFAGDDCEQAVVSADAQALLSHYEARAMHYEVVATPQQTKRDAWLQTMPRHRIEWHW